MASQQGSSTSGVSLPEFRLPVVLLIGWPLTILSFYLVMRIEQIEKIGLPTGIAIYYPVVVIFALLLLVNRLVGRNNDGGARLSVSELLCMYSMMNLGACFASWESFGTFIPSLAYPAYAVASSPLNSWLQPVIAALPSWAIVKDPAAATAIFQGHPWSTVWRGWLVPLSAWGGLLCTLFLMYLALTRLLWESWAHDEKLAFPLTMVPIEMSDPGATLWKSRLFWAGGAFAAALDLLNGLHQIIPAFPTLFEKGYFIRFDSAGPAWSALGTVPITIHPLMFGIAFLLRTDLLFSTWFFYLLGQAQLYVAGMLGVAHGSPYIFLGNSPGLLAQNFGAMCVLVAALLWNSKSLWFEHIRRIRGGEIRVIENYAILAVGSIVLLFAFNQLGLSIWLAALALLILLVLAIFVSRLRAELGLAVHNLQFMGPDGPLIGVFNGHLLTAHNNDAFTALSSLSRSLQGHPMPHLMEAAYMADRVGTTSRRFWTAIALTGILCVIGGAWLFLWMTSGRGLELMTGNYQNLGAEGWGHIRGFAMSPHVPDIGAIEEMGGGTLVTVLLIVLQRFWIGCPFHPVGYAISGSWGTSMVWVPVFIAWLVKSLTLKYGGAAAYRKGVSFALGLVLGEFVAGAFWTAFSLLFGVQGYRIWLF